MAVGPGFSDTGKRRAPGTGDLGHLIDAVNDQLKKGL